MKINKVKFISRDKLSKKKKKELDKEKRTIWTLNPVTRVPKNPKAYDRNKEKKWKNSNEDNG